MKNISLLYPDMKKQSAKELSETTMHDLGLDAVCASLTPVESEQGLIYRVMRQITGDAETVAYRIAIFDDIYRLPDMGLEMIEVLKKIDFMRGYGSFQRERHEKAGAWDLIHRLEELHDYIVCVETIYRCLSAADIRSEGLTRLLKYVQQIYRERGFEDLRRDVDQLRASTANLKSITLGINLNDRFEAMEVGLISVNNRYFTKSGVISHFADRLSVKDQIKEGTEWQEEYRYDAIDPQQAGRSFQEGMNRYARYAAARTVPLTMAAFPDGDGSADMPGYLTEIMNHIVSVLVRKLRNTLNKYVTVTITDITDLIPEFVYYIRWADYVRSLQKRGLPFVRAQIASASTDRHSMRAKGIYNLKLCHAEDVQPDQIVKNDLMFDAEHRVFVLTGANRGGKTTITQAIGQIYVLAQGGIYIPGESFAFDPVDCIYTHFPADEDKTLDLGRLGEECSRFKSMYQQSTAQSLMLLNETFSTTSFEEGYYIAVDAVRALLHKGVRTIYNTHMHKLAFEIDEINRVSRTDKAASLIVVSEKGQRSFRIKISPPEGSSYAQDIARKYGVTYDMLVDGQQDDTTLSE